MLKPDGDICLIDFNIALALGEDGAVKVGFSRGYASPEHYGADYISGQKKAAVGEFPKKGIRGDIDWRRRCFWEVKHPVRVFKGRPGGRKQLCWMRVPIFTAWGRRFIICFRDSVRRRMLLKWNRWGKIFAARKFRISYARRWRLIRICGINLRKRCWPPFYSYIKRIGEWYGTEGTR